MSFKVEAPPSAQSEFGFDDYVDVPRFGSRDGTELQPESYYTMLGLPNPNEDSVREDRTAARSPDSILWGVVPTDNEDSVEVRADKHGGKGLFATRDIAPNKLVGIFYDVVKTDPLEYNPYR